MLAPASPAGRPSGGRGPRARPRPRTHCGADVYPDERTRLRNTSSWSCTAPRAAGGNETKKPLSARPVLTATARTPLLRHRKAQAERGHDLQTQGVSHLAPNQPIPAKQVTSRPFTAQGNSENGPSRAVNDTAALLAPRPRGPAPRPAPRRGRRAACGRHRHAVAKRPHTEPGPRDGVRHKTGLRASKELHFTKQRQIHLPRSQEQSLFPTNSNFSFIT